jgi:hypothetical protein
MITVPASGKLRHCEDFEFTAKALGTFNTARDHGYASAANPTSTLAPSSLTTAERLGVSHCTHYGCYPLDSSYNSSC